jgi:hypothetical protein
MARKKPAANGGGDCRRSFLTVLNNHPGFVPNTGRSFSMGVWHTPLESSGVNRRAHGVRRIAGYSDAATT